MTKTQLYDRAHELRVKMKALLDRRYAVVDVPAESPERARRRLARELAETRREMRKVRW